jgi:hypothetical protein
MTSKTIYYNLNRTYTTFTCSDKHTDYHILLFKLRANSDTDVYQKLLWWNGQPSGDGCPYTRWNFTTGRAENSTAPAYKCDAVVWGGDSVTIGYRVDSYNTENWRVGVIVVVGFRFV